MVTRDRAKPGEALVTLWPGADFSFRWPESRPDGALLRIYSWDRGRGDRKIPEGGRVAAPESRPHRRSRPQMPDAEVLCDATGSARIESLAPGRYVAAVEVGDVSAPLVLTERWIDHAAGTHDPVSLAFGGLERGSRGSISGIVVLNGRELSEGLSLVLEPFGPISNANEPGRRLSVATMAPIVGNAREVSWSFDGIPTGEYLLRLEPLWIQQRAIVTSEGLRDVRVEVPPNADVTIRVVDDDTDQSVTQAAVRWCSATSVLFGCMALVKPTSDERTVTRDETRGIYAFSAPAHDVNILVVAKGFAPEILTALTLTSGANDHTIRLVREMGVRIRAIDMATRERIPDAAVDGLRASAVAVDDDRGKASAIFRDGATILLVRRPGDYRVSLEPPPGYRKPKNVTATVQNGSIVDATFEVERK